MTITVKLSIRVERETGEGKTCSRGVLAEYLRLYFPLVFSPCEGPDRRSPSFSPVS